jgi:sugar lactone lactonase YvrE/prenyltransferase beta subunit
MRLFAVLLALSLPSLTLAEEWIPRDEVLRGLRDFYAKTARDDGSFQPGIDPDYRGMSDSAFSDLAAVTYAVTIHKTFGWKLPHEEKTIEFLLSRQLESGDFVNEAGTVDPTSPQGRVYNTTQALVALHALGVKPRHDPLPVFEEILKQDYKTLPAYSTSFFPLAYLCYGKPIPEQADRAIRALMVPDRDGYLNSHIAATFHSSHYYALVGEPTPMAEQMIARALRDQHRSGSWFLNEPARDRHATFDAVFTLRHEGGERADCQAAIRRAAKWAFSCRNDDGGFGHFPGSTSDADAVYFQVGTLVMAGVLKPADPLPENPHLISWGHLMPLRKERPGAPRRFTTPGWVGGVALSHDGHLLAAGSSDGVVRLWDLRERDSSTEFKGHRDAVAAVAFSANDEWLVSASHDHTAIAWDLRSKESTPLVGHRGAVLSVAASPDGSRIATGSIDQTIKLWNAESLKEERTLSGHRSWVNALAFSPDGRRLYSGSSDGTLRVWSAESGELLHTIDASQAEVRSIAVSPDGTLVAAGIRYGAVKLWRTSNWRLVQELKEPADDTWSLAFSSDSEWLLVAAGEWNRPTEIGVFDVTEGKKLRSLRHTGEVLSLATSREGHLLAAGGWDQAISIWDLRDQRQGESHEEKKPR